MVVKQNVALYKPINFVSEIYYMSNGLTPQIPSKTLPNSEYANIIKIGSELTEESTKFIHPG